MSNQRHTIIVGPQGSGKSLRAHELARAGGQTHAGIRCIAVSQVLDLYGIERAMISTAGSSCIAVSQVLDLYGIERAMQDEPAVLIIENVAPGAIRVWDFLSQLAGQPTWSMQRKGQWPRRVAAPTMIVTAQAMPAGWSAPDHIWRVIELIPAAA